MKSKATGNRALILVDLQNDFAEGGSLAVPDGMAVVAIANRMMPNFDLVIATQDWHPADHQSFASQHSEVSIGQQFILNGLPQTAWPDHCIQETVGAELVASLETHRIAKIVRKGTDKAIDSYSGFYDNGHQKSTGLAEFLRSKGVDRVAVMGLATDYCVRFTALDAIKEGFETTLILDGCRGVELRQGDIAKAVEELERAGVEIANTHIVTNLWGRQTN